MPIVRLLTVGLMWCGWKLGVFLGQGIAKMFSYAFSRGPKAAQKAGPSRTYNDAGLSNDEILQQIYRWGRKNPKGVAQHYLFANGLYHPELNVDRMNAQQYEFMFKKMVSKHPGTLNEYMDLLRWMAANDPQRFSYIRTSHPR